MVNKKLNLEDKYKILGIFLILITMGLCQFHWFAGDWKPIFIPKEMWAIISLIITQTFVAVSGISIPTSKTVVHVKGLVMGALLIMIGLSIYFNIEVGREWWSIVGTITGFVYGGKSSGEN